MAQWVHEALGDSQSDSEHLPARGKAPSGVCKGTVDNLLTLISEHNFDPTKTGTGA